MLSNKQSFTSGQLHNKVCSHLYTYMKKRSSAVLRSDGRLVCRDIHGKLQIPFFWWPGSQAYTYIQRVNTANTLNSTDTRKAWEEKQRASSITNSTPLCKCWFYYRGHYQIWHLKPVLSTVLSKTTQQKQTSFDTSVCKLIRVTMYTVLWTSVRPPWIFL